MFFRDAPILIPHRLSAAGMADGIIVISDEQVVEEGTHDALPVADEMYAELFHR